MMVRAGHSRFMARAALLFFFGRVAPGAGNYSAGRMLPIMLDVTLLLIMLDVTLYRMSPQSCKFEIMFFKFCFPTHTHRQTQHVWTSRYCSNSSSGEYFSSTPPTYIESARIGLFRPKSPTSLFPKNFVQMLRTDSSTLRRIYQVHLIQNRNTCYTYH